VAIEPSFEGTGASRQDEIARPQLPEEARQILGRELTARRQHGDQLAPGEPAGALDGRRLVEPVAEQERAHAAAGAPPALDLDRRERRAIAHRVDDLVRQADLAEDRLQPLVPWPEIGPVPGDKDDDRDRDRRGHGCRLR
jgi:hypothetical protein